MEFGSFVALIVCPADPEAIAEQPKLQTSKVGKPLSEFTRDITTEFMRSANVLVNAIRNDTADQLSSATSDVPGVSANFCDALAKMAPATESATLSITARWSTSLPNPDSNVSPTTVRVPKSYFGTIEAVANELRPKSKSSTEEFVGTVDQLAGEPGKEGKMEGKVSLKLYVDGKWRNVRSALRPNDYALACDMHKTQDLIKIAATIHVDNNRASIETYQHFKKAKETKID